MRIFLLTIIGLITSTIHGQVNIDKLNHDFGHLEAFSERFVDIHLTNNGTKTAYILRVDKPQNVTYLVSSSAIQIDSVATLRIQINSKKTGKFNYTINVYTSDKNDATKITLIGNTKELPPNQQGDLTACPSFSARPAGNKSSTFDLTILTIDQITKEPIANVAVTQLQNGQQISANPTNKNGKIKRETSVGYSYFYATHPAYYPAEKGFYIDPTRNQVVLELLPDRVSSGAIAILEEENTSSEELTVEITIDNQLEEQLKKSDGTVPNTAASNNDTVSTPISLSSLDKDNFSTDYFQPIHVVFVLDISASMKQGDKMELLKFSLLELVKMLRAEDKMGIVTYSSSAKVSLPTVSGIAKTTLEEHIQALKASGMTAGGAGIKLGYKQVAKHHITDGINQVILITDGAFNHQSKDYQRTIKKYQKKGIRLSVVGIQNKSTDEKLMEEAAALGGGRYIPIAKLLDAKQNLKEEIRHLTFRQNK